MLSDQDNQLLFVYGTLRRLCGSHYHQILNKHADFISEAHFQGCLFNVSHYPAVIDSKDPEKLVLGEVYKLNDPKLVFDLLDDYEECCAKFSEPHEYKRELRTIHLDQHQTTIAWIYLYNLPTKDLIQINSGNYLHYLLNQNTK